MERDDYFLDVISTKEHSPAASLLRTCATLLTNNELVDCTLICGDGNVQAHRVVLASTGKYMYNLLTSAPSPPTPCSHPMIFLKKYRIQDLQSLLEYMYTGQTSIHIRQLANVMRLADELEYKTLSAAIARAKGKSAGAGVLPAGGVATPGKNKNAGTFKEESERQMQCHGRNAGEAEAANDNMEEHYVKCEILSDEDSSSSPDSVHPGFPSGARKRGSTEEERGGEGGKFMKMEGAVENEEEEQGGGQEALYSIPYPLNDNEDDSGEDENEDDLSGFVHPEELLEVSQDFKMEDGMGLPGGAQPCPWCQESFTNMGALQKHLRTHVNKYRPYSCEFCHNSFARSAHLKRHLRVHTGEKPYVCSVCQRAFARQDKLKGHMERHLQHAVKNDGVSILDVGPVLPPPPTSIDYQPQASSQAQQLPVKSNFSNKPRKPSTSASILKTTSPDTTTTTTFANGGGVGNKRFEIGTTSSNGLSISFATSAKPEKSLNAGGLIVTPAVVGRPSSGLQPFVQNGVSGNYREGGGRGYAADGEILGGLNDINMSQRGNSANSINYAKGFNYMMNYNSI